MALKLRPAGATAISGRAVTVNGTVTVAGESARAAPAEPAPATPMVPRYTPGARRSGITDTASPEAAGTARSQLTGPVTLAVAVQVNGVPPASSTGMVRPAGAAPPST